MGTIGVTYAYAALEPSAPLRSAHHLHSRRVIAYTLGVSSHMAMSAPRRSAHDLGGEGGRLHVVRDGRVGRQAIGAAAAAAAAPWSARPATQSCRMHSRRVLAYTLGV